MPFAILFISACSSKALVVPETSRLSAAANPAPEPYRLQVGDSIAVKFYQNATLDEEVVVRPDGMISLQLIGELEAAGKAPAELARQIEQAYLGELATPRVTVIVRELGGNRVYVGGEVGTQGVLSLSGGLTMFQAIQEAGGFLTTAHRKQVILIRKGTGGEPEGYQIDLRPVANGERPTEDMFLQPYDVVYVPRSKIANVNLFVQQYIRDVLPIQFALPVF